MAFVVQCPFCKLRARVPERANGANGKCPRCANSFTLAPADDQSMAEVAPPASHAEANGADVPISSTAVAVAIAVAAATSKKPAAGAERSAPDSEAIQRPARSNSRPATLASLVALLLGGAAVWCASFSVLCRVVIPLGGLGCLAAVVAIVLAWSAPRRRLILPIAGSTATSAVLISALLFPSVLGPTFFRARLGAGSDPNLLRAIPIDRAPMIGEVPDWVDASQYALQRGELRVQVASVSVGPLLAKVDAKGKSEVKGKGARSELLLVRVRVQMPLGDKNSNGDAKPIDWSQNRNPTLSDSSGTTYVLRETRVLEPSDAARKSHLFPLSTTDQIFAFEAPAAGWSSLRLEMPAAAWGGDGVFRFTLPSAMLLANPTKATSPPKGGS